MAGCPANSQERCKWTWQLVSIMQQLSPSMPGNRPLGQANTWCDSLFILFGSELLPSFYMGFRFTPWSKPLNPAATHEARRFGCAVFFCWKKEYILSHAANLKRVFSRFGGLFVQHGRGRRCRSVQDGKRNCRRHRDSDQDFWTASRAWATSCFESLEYGFPNQSDQSVKNKYTNIQIQLFPYSISGNGQDMQAGWQLAATILVMTFYLVLPKHSLHTDILGPWKWAPRVWASWRSSSRFSTGFLKTCCECDDDCT